MVRGTEEEQQSITLALKHLQYMPYDFQILTYKWISQVYYENNQWKKTMYYAKKLELTAREGYYYGRALAYQGYALMQLGGTLALYHCAQNKFDEGLHELLDVANRAYEFEHLQRFKQCLQMYWKFKSQINIEHEKKFIQLLT
ncbi:MULTISPECIES: hypothetical protein [Bacillaceae]|uniref:hypothetical protein n=1 Tax=Bacillaceae TaxID=186817 RepID=UPI000BFA52F8|nr:hypothetical protein [Bacillus sp. AFS077874]PFM81725.1 hypothetical protein COJ46_06485 [Bacillus sp. AFS077874]